MIIPINMRVQPNISLELITSPKIAQPDNAPKIDSKLIKIAAVDGSAYF